MKIQASRQSGYVKSNPTSHIP